MISAVGPRSSGIDWVDEVPARWSVVPFFSVVDEVVFPNERMKEKNLLSLSYGRIVRKDINKLEGLTPESFEGYNVVDANDIVFRLTDLQNDKNSLRSALVSERGIITSAYVTARPRSTPRFFNYLMRSYDTSKVFYGIGGGIRQSMKYDDLKRLPVVLPDENERERIADFLDHETARIDTLVAKKNRFIQLLAEKRQALVSHAVTKGLDPNVPMMDSGVEWLGKIPAHWALPKLRHIANIQTGTALGKDAKGKQTISVPYLRVANVQDGYLDLSDIQEIWLPAEQLQRFRLRKGDVLMNEGGDNDKLGRGHIWDGEIDVCVHQNHVFAVRPHGVTSRWLSMYAGTTPAQFFFLSKAKQTTNLASISSTSLMDLPVPQPPTDEQIAIVAYIELQTSHVDALAAKTERSIELLREHRTALITAAVTGKIDLRSAA
jgi:type I restriction enzyme S subunit